MNLINTRMIQDIVVHSFNGMVNTRINPSFQTFTQTHTNSIYHLGSKPRLIRVLNMNI